MRFPTMWHFDKSRLRQASAVSYAGPVIKHLEDIGILKCVNLFVCVDALSPSQQFFSHVGTISCLPGLNWY